MGNICASEADVARMAAEKLREGGEFLARGDLKRAEKAFEQGLRILPFNEFVTKDVSAPSLEEAGAGVEEASQQIVNHNRQVEKVMRVQRQESKARLFDEHRHPKKKKAIPKEMEEYRRVVSMMRRTTRQYGNMQMGMELHDLQRVIGGSVCEDIEQDERQKEVTAAQNILRRPSIGAAAGVHSDGAAGKAASHRFQRRRTIGIIEPHHLPPRREKASLPPPPPPESTVEVGILISSATDEFAAFSSSSPSEPEATPSVNGDGLFSAAQSPPLSPVPETLAVASPKEMPKPQDIAATRSADDRTTMKIVVETGTDPLLSAKSAIALYRVSDAYAIEGVLRVLKYRLMVGDLYLINGLTDLANEQYLLVSGATMFLRMKETYAYVQMQNLRINERACLGISATSLEKARQIAKEPSKCGNKEEAQAEINRNLAVALQHSISVRKSEACKEETLADILRAPYNMSLDEHNHQRAAINTSDVNVLDDVALTRAEFVSQTNVLKSSEELLAEEHLIQNMTDARRGRALKGVIDSHSDVMCADGTYLWTSVPLIDALRLEAECRLEMILRNNMATQAFDADDQDECLVGTREDAQTVITGFQRAVGLCVSKHLASSLEYKKLKARLVEARKLLGWTPAALQREREGRVERIPSFKNQSNGYHRRKSVLDVMQELDTSRVATKHNNYFFTSAQPADNGCETSPFSAHSSAPSSHGM